MEKLLYLGGLLLIIGSCGLTASKNENKDTSAGLSSISINVPKKSDVASDVELQEKLNAAQLTITPRAGGDCSSIPLTSFSWSDNQAISIPKQILKQGCDYTFLTEFGYRGSSNKNLTQVFYSGSKFLKKEEIGTQSNLTVSITVAITDAGRAAHFNNQSLATPGELKPSNKISADLLKYELISDSDFQLVKSFEGLEVTSELTVFNPKNSQLSISIRKLDQPDLKNANVVTIDVNTLQPLSFTQVPDLLLTDSYFFLHDLTSNGSLIGRSISQSYFGEERLTLG